MSLSLLASDGGITVAGGILALVGVVAIVAVAALVVAWVLVREVLAHDEGTPSMRDIGAAVQEGANAYLNRQFRTLAIFAANLHGATPADAVSPVAS